MSKYWSPYIRSIAPYIPGEQPQDRQYIKLNTNENPYPPSPRVMEVLKNSIKEDIRLYPDPECQVLRYGIADYYNLQGPEEVFVGNGSDEVLAFSFMAFFKSSRPILFPEITYSFYPVYCSLFNIEYQMISLKEDFTIPVEEFSRENGGIIFPNPNAPTGIYLPIEKIEGLLQKNLNSLLIIDEAYIDFGGDSAVGLIKEYPNLLIIQTMSKSRALAGLRIGFAIGQKDLIEGLNRVKNSFNSYTLDRLVQVAARESLKDEAYFQKMRERLIKTRERIANELIKRGFTVLPSRTNFLLISHPLYQAENLFKALKERGILVRYFKQPGIENYLRVSIGSEQEMDVFIRNIDEIIS
jgi:histidinol-phosphate aminotransferase